MLIEHEVAFVLHVRPWRETSLLVEVLTQAYGRLGLIARGVQGLKKQTLRAALQPLQWIRFSAIQRGELGQLRQAEALDTAPRLKGETMLASFYINELLLRLVPRHAPVNELYLAYSQTRERLRTNDSLAWSLRLFEFDILETLGVGFNLEYDANGTPLDPAARYVLDPLEGPRLLLSEHNNAERRDTATGHVLLALAHKQIPNTNDLAGLRRSMRAVLLHHLGGRGLKSWEMIAAFRHQDTSP
ncbi:DNA repair protein RecO [Xylella fastidiosa]|uniref:DNA repair protein RecO n=1 Tax=Xylella fastidiosa subsp. sandyi Ann-1 TaxID=155920 RepID=A0A060HAK0_XYLFS|nr:DNA repair protein RecO [Xylella fastidiosa]AIC09917.1 DNA repair protein RecO [Xylella fastidiosa subsp. sandyi Ann-1]UIX82424.1 DNA repair protein RecO [Xylella fastidiosa subsp. sandyi]